VGPVLAVGVGPLGLFADQPVRATIDVVFIRSTEANWREVVRQSSLDAETPERGR
jgi:hypothetical protein